MQSFHLDKSRNVIYEALMEDDIKQFYALRGVRVNVYENPADDQVGREAYDRKVSTGDLWELKHDRIWGTTGRVFLEIPHEHSQADYFLIQTFLPCVMSKSRFLEVLKRYPHRQAGDYGRAEGILVSLEELFTFNEMYP